MMKVSPFFKFLKSLVLVSIALTSFGQERFVQSPCGFDHIHEEKLLNADYLKSLSSFDKIIDNKINSPSFKSTKIYRIPVVVHVFHLGEQVGFGTNISDAQIQSAITNLTDVYRKNMSSQVSDESVDISVEFILAQRDPNCNPTNGIVRINARDISGYLSNGVNYENTNGVDDVVLKDLSKWPTDKYMNFWIVSEIDNNNGGSGIQGYANLPVAIDDYNGSVMMSSIFGYTPGNSRLDNSTVIHEVGHFLGLYHPFQGGDTGVCPPTENSVDCNTKGDRVCDTPPIMNYLNFENNNIYFNCPNGISNPCSSGTLDQIMHNFMNYTNCPDRFTEGQKDRMIAVLESSRASLTTSLGLIPPNDIYTQPITSCNSFTSGLGLTGYYGGILNVKLNGFSNSSNPTNEDNSTNGYMDYTSSCLDVISLNTDNAYSMNVTTFYNTHKVKVWIDYNNDGDFNDLNEEITSSGGVTSTNGAEVSINFTVPSNVVIDEYLRMRVKAEAGSGNFTSCSTLTYGQAEDYTVYITTPFSSDFTLSNENICINSSVSISSFDLEGIATSWDWTISPSTGVSFTNLTSNSSQNPVIQFLNPGIYSITLSTSDGNLNTSLTKNNILTVTGQTTSIVDENLSICSNSTFKANATASNGSILWTTSGNGAFSNSTAEDAVYFPSQNDINTGSVSLRMTVSNDVCGSIHDELILSFDKAVVIEAGIKDYVCLPNTYQFTPTVSNYSSILWSGGELLGSFNDPTLPNSTFIPNLNNSQNSSVEFTITAQGIGACPSKNDKVILDIYVTPNILAGDDFTVCDNDDVQLNATATNPSIVWSTSGDGSFSNNSSQNPLYYLGDEDISNGNVVLTLKSSNLLCPIVSDDVSISINPSPIVSLAPFSSLCNYSQPLDLSGGTPDDGFYRVEGELATVFIPSNYGNGDYSISYEYTNEFNCKNLVSQNISVLECALANSININLLKIYPNPTSGEINMISGNLLDELMIIDQTGRIVFQSKVDSKVYNYTFDSDIENGVYSVIISQNGYKSSYKLTLLK